MPASRVSIRESVERSRPFRMRSKMSSSRWAALLNTGYPSMPAMPLRVCVVRNSAFTEAWTTWAGWGSLSVARVCRACPNRSSHSAQTSSKD